MPTLEPWQEQFKRDIVQRFEGLCTTLYRDSVGLVTVGWGCQVSEREACTLPFLINGVRALPQEIAAEYDLVSTMPVNWLAPRYANSASPRLQDVGVEMLCNARITAKTMTLRAMFPGFDAWPISGKIATLEMPWGLRGFTSSDTYPAFKRALRQKPPDFVTAARECVWAKPPGIYKDRNANRQALYLSAAKEVAHAPATP